MKIIYKFGDAIFILLADGLDLQLEEKYMPYHIEDSAESCTEKGQPSFENNYKNQDAITIRITRKDSLSEETARLTPDFELNQIKYWSESHDRVYSSYRGAYAWFHMTGPQQYALDFFPENAIRMERETDFWNCIPVESLLLDQQYLILHSSYIRTNEADGNKAILFFAPSGTGKSTQAELWKTYRQADIINGDRSLLSIKESKLLAHGLPFCGSSEYWMNATTQVSALVYLKQGNENTIRQLKEREAIGKMLPECTLNNWNPQAVDQVLTLLQEIIQQVPVYELSCRPDEGAVCCLVRELAQRTIIN